MPRHAQFNLALNYVLTDLHLRRLLGSCLVSSSCFCVSLYCCRSLELPEPLTHWINMSQSTPQFVYPVYAEGYLGYLWVLLWRFWNFLLVPRGMCFSRANEGQSSSQGCIAAILLENASTSEVAETVYTPSAPCESSQWPTPSATSGTILLVYFCPSGGCVMVSHCGLTWISLTTEEVGHILIHLLAFECLPLRSAS